VDNDVRLVPAELEDKSVVRRLLEFNAYEFSRFDGADTDIHGTFGYRFLDHYWTEPDRHPFLIQVGPQLAGIALVRGGRPNSIAEFLVLPKYRRCGVGRAAARAVFSLFHGDWETHEVPGNDRAVEFWRQAIPVEFTETTSEDGTTQRFTVTS
jgi:predicted acetyltransferase